MSRSGSTGPLAAGVGVSLRPPVSPRRTPQITTPYEDLQLKYASLQKDYSDLHEALFEATQVYRRLCAPRFVRYREVEIASETFAARHLPGDFCTVDERDGNPILALGDISGKGISAGMWTTLMLGLIATHSSRRAEPQTIVSGVNDDLCRMTLGAPLASLFLSELDTRTGVLNYCSAGHPPAMLLRSDGSLESLSDGGPLLGVVPEAWFAEGSVKLSPGDLLFVYSDGIIEARNSADQEFGYEQLEAHARRAPQSSADAVLFSILGAVQDFVGRFPQADDMTLMVLRWTKHSR